MIDGKYITGEALSNIWDDLLSNNIHNEGGVKFPKGKKPEALIKRVFDLFSDKGDLVMDSFLGSGTTAAVAHKMGRKWLGVEMGAQAETHCVPRLSAVIAGDQGGISQSVGWKGGGGFAFYRLGAAVFDGDGAINPGIAFAPLAAHVWFSETGVPYHFPPSPSGEGPRVGVVRQDQPSTNTPHPNPSPKEEGLKSPFLGHHDGRGLALLYNGILGDKRVSGGNVLTRKTLALIRDAAGSFAGPITVYGEASRLSPETLKAEGIAFKQTPYDVRAR